MSNQYIVYEQPINNWSHILVSVFLGTGKGLFNIYQILFKKPQKDWTILVENWKDEIYNLLL